MIPRLLIPTLLLTSAMLLAGQETPVHGASAHGSAGQDTMLQNAPPSESRREVRYSLAVIDDTTLYSDLQAPLPKVHNQSLIEPTLTLRYKARWSFSSSLICVADRYADTFTQVRVKEAYGALSAGDFDIMLGRRMVRWGTGYAFTAAGVLDPPRMPTNPSDRLSLNEGRDMLKVDYVHGPHALTVAWSSAALAPAAVNLHDTMAFRYNVLVHGFDTALIAGHDRGGDSFGALTFTRVFGDALEIHGEAAWREQEAILIGSKYTTPAGITFIAEFFTPPNTPYYQDATFYPLHARQHSLFISAYKNRLRELPHWKQWDMTASAVANLDDRSYTAVFDVTRRFGNHFSSYFHVEVPAGTSKSEYGATPYSAASSIGIRFEL